MRVIRPGDLGEDVRDVQRRLIALGHQIVPDEQLEGRLGASTGAAVRDFQHGRRLPIDGLVGPDTWGQLVEAGYALGDRVLYLRYPFLRGDDVRELQRRLNALGFDAGREDGILGRETDGAIRDFQRNVGRAVDGIVGPDTVTAVARLRPDSAAVSRAVVREAEAVRSMRDSVAGAVVGIDVGGSDASSTTTRLAAILVEELARRGAQPLQLGDPILSPGPDARRRAAEANDGNAVAYLALTSPGDGSGGSQAGCAYFGTGTTYSPAGRRLAELIQARLCRLGFADRGTRPLAISVLRETRMPAVLVEADIAGTSGGGTTGLEELVASVAGATADALEEFLGAAGGAGAETGSSRRTQSGQGA